MKLWIWWTDQKACEVTGPLPDYFPKWLKAEYQSRLGRNGRGRLWTATKFTDSEASCVEAFDAMSPMAKWLEDYAGIVIDFHAKQALLMHQVAGVITDFSLKQSGPQDMDF